MLDLDKPHTVEDLRNELVNWGWTIEQADALKGKKQLQEVLINLRGDKEPVLQDIELQVVGEFENAEEDSDVNSDVVIEDLPKIYSAEWNDYVMGKFLPDELIDGRPTVDGLRRVFTEVMGKILDGYPEVVQSPDPHNHNRATVAYFIEWQDEDGDRRRIGDACDVYSGNCTEFHNHPVGVASTRAEGRALRKALGLRKILAAEEVSDNDASEPEEFFNPDKKMTKSQAIILDNLCKRTNIDGWKLVNFGTKKYACLNDILYDVCAQKMIKYVNKFQQKDPETGVIPQVPAEIAGYKEDFVSTHWIEGA
jgi:hypothetical protein